MSPVSWYQHPGSGNKVLDSVASVCHTPAMSHDLAHEIILSDADLLKDDCLDGLWASENAGWTLRPVSDGQVVVQSVYDRDESEITVRLSWKRDGILWGSRFVANTLQTPRESVLSTVREMLRRGPAVPG